jgi:hypothetical protein
MPEELHIKGSLENLTAEIVPELEKVNIQIFFLGFFLLFKTGSHYIAQTGLVFTILCLRVLGLQTYATTPSYKFS